MQKRTVTALQNALKKPQLTLRRWLFLSSTGLSLGVLLAGPLVHADTYQQQINNLNSQNSQAQSVLSGLQTTALSYQGAIDALQQQISSIEAAISSNQAAEAADNAKIASDQQQIAQNKTILSDDLKTMYVDGQMTTIEELATSKNLSDYVDAQEYRSLIQNKVTTLLQSIQTLEEQAQQQKQQVVALVATEQSQQTQLNADQAQQQQMLNANQSQQDQYNAQISANNAQIGKLRAEQAAANAAIARAANVAASGGSGGACDIGQGNGGYPLSWCNDAMDTSISASGFGLARECTSFAYWYFTTVEGQANFSVSGNAGWWWETSNYPVTTWNGSVQVGAIGIEPSSSLNAPVPSLHGGYYGHVMIVKALPGQTYGGQYVPSGYVLVSSMNEDEAGHFMYNLWPVDYLMFINPQ